VGLVPVLLTVSEDFGVMDRDGYCPMLHIFLVVYIIDISDSTMRHWLVEQQTTAMSLTSIPVHWIRPDFTR